MMEIALIVSLLAFHDDVKKTPVTCGQIKGYVASFGIQSVINGARQHGATEKEIAMALKRCGIKGHDVTESPK